LRLWAALALALIALALPACGGDSEPSSETDVKPPDLTVPSTDSTDAGEDEPGLGDESTDTGGDDPSTAEQAPGEGDGTGDDPSTAEQAPGESDGNSADDGTNTPDSATNDTPPESGSAAERFEQYCETNPGAC